MKHSFLFKRGKFYHLEYYEESGEKPKRISTGCTKKSEAIDFLTNFDKDKTEQPKIKPISLKDYLSIYKQYILTNLSKKYLADVQTTENKILEFIGNVPLLKLNTLILEQFISSEAIKSKHQAVKQYNNLRSALNKAISWGYLQVNPLLKIKPVKPPKNNPLFIYETELDLVLDKEQNPTLKDIYRFAFHTGMRLGEIINLKWNAVDLTEKIIKVQNTDTFTTKGKRERVIPINEKLFFLLSNRLPKIISINKDEYVFHKKGFKFNGDYISKHFKIALKQTSIDPRFHFHDIRHSTASNLAMKGIPIPVIMEILGHNSISTTMIYSHIRVESLKQAVKVLEG